MYPDFGEHFENYQRHLVTMAGNSDINQAPRVPASHQSMLRAQYTLGACLSMVSRLQSYRLIVHVVYQSFGGSLTYVVSLLQLYRTFRGTCGLREPEAILTPGLYVRSHSKSLRAVWRSSQLLTKGWMYENEETMQGCVNKYVRLGNESGR
jgi:hypothetical protein